MQIKINGIFLEVEDHGSKDGIPLVLIRGLGTQIVQWPAELIGGFTEKGYRVIVFDNRDVGLSQRCPGDGAMGDADEIIAAISAGKPTRAAYTMFDMARDVVGILDALEIPKAHIAGISMGGRIAQLLAAYHPDRLLSATYIMTSANPVARLDEHLDRLGLLLARPVSKETFIRNHLTADASWGSPGYPMTEEELRAQANEMWERGAEPEGVNRQLLAMLATEYDEAAIRNISVSSQVIHGLDDALIPPDKGQELADMVPNCPFHGVEGMGHTITPKLAPAIVDLISNFIRSSQA